MSLIVKDAHGVFDPRIQIAGYWGVSAYSARSVNYTSGKAFEIAKKMPGFLKGVSVWGARTNDKSKEAPLQDVLASGYTLPNFDSPLWGIWNGKANWKIEVGASQDLETIPNPFRTGPGLLYANATPNRPARLQSDVIVRANGSFMLRLGLVDINDKFQKYQNVGVVWGSAPYRFRLEWNKGASSGHTIWLHRLLPAWTPAQQNALDQLSVAIRDAKGASGNVSALETQYWELWHTLYAQSDQLSALKLSQLDGKEYGEFVVVPEPALTRVRVFSGGRSSTGNGQASSGDETVSIIPHPLETEARKAAPAGQLWGATRLQLSTNGGVMMWQVGLPDWSRLSVITLPSALKGGAAIGGHWDESQPGTDVAFVLQPLPPDNDFPEGDILPVEESEEEFQPRIELVSDGRYPALLYDAYGWMDGGERNGSTAFAWDSNDHRTLGLSPIMDIIPTCQGPFNRLSFRVTMGLYGTLIENDGTYQRLFHDRMARLTVNGQTLLGNGLILRAVGNNWDKSEQNAAIVQVTSYDSLVEWEIVDLWQILDEWLITEDPILDGLYLGAALRRLIKLPGTKAGEVSGINATAGPVLDRAGVGQEACERPAYETTVGDAVRALMQKYAPDWGLSPRSGVWTLTEPSNEFVARFTHDPKPNQAIPEFPILDPFDVIRDYTRFYNLFRLRGGPAVLDARDPTKAPSGAFGENKNALQGEPVVADWFERLSAQYPPSKNHIGRLKMARTVNDQGKRTAGQALQTVRNIAKEGTRMGRFFKFGSPTILNLYPGAKVYVGDTPGILDSIGDGSISYGQGVMQISVQEGI